MISYGARNTRSSHNVLLLHAGLFDPFTLFRPEIPPLQKMFNNMDACHTIAGAGGTVVLADGRYTEAILTVQGGEEGNPLTITGRRDAVISADGAGR